MILKTALPLLIRILSSLFQGLTLVILASCVSQDSFGQYSTICAIGAICIGLLGFGLPIQALQIRQSDNKDLRDIYISIGFMLSIMSLLLTSTASYISYNIPLDILVAASLFISSELKNNISQAVLYGVGMANRADLLLFLRRLIPFLMVCVFSLSNKSEIFKSLIGAYLSLIAFDVIFFDKFKFKITGYIELLKTSKHYWLNGIWTMFQQLDIVFINHFFGAIFAASYAAAFRLASPIHLVTSLIISRLLPALSAEKDTNKQYSLNVKYIKYSALYAVLILLFSPLSSFVFPMFLGVEYSKYSYVFPVLLIASAASVLNQVMSVIFFSVKQEKLVQKSTRAATFVGLLIIFIGCSVDSFHISIVGNMLAQIFLLIFFVTFFKNKFSIKLDGVIICLKR